MEKKLVKSFEQMCQEMVHPSFSNAVYLDDFAKAISAYGITGMGDATPLRLEDLDATMTSILYDESHLQMFNAVPRVPSRQVYYEYNKRKGYGSSRGVLGFVEGGTPVGGVSNYERLGAYIRFLGVKRGITHQLTMVGQAGGIQVDPVAEENRNGTLALLESVDRGILWSDSLVLDAYGGNTINYDGLIKQVTTGASTHVIDWAGNPPDFDMFEDIAYKLFQETYLANFGAVRCFMHGSVLASLSAQLRQMERRYLTAAAPKPLAPGEPLSGVQTNFGWLPFTPHVFMDAVPGGQPCATADTGAPAAPATCTGAATDDGTPGLPAGTYYYKASAVNAYGESLPVASSGVAATEGQKITLTIAYVAAATFYRVYRKAANGTFYYIGKVVQTSGGSASFVDQNEWQPNTGMMVIGNFVPDNIAVAQLAPLVKFPLAVVSTTIEFLLLLYHTLVVKAPERFFIVKNIGPYVPA